MRVRNAVYESGDVAVGPDLVCFGSRHIPMAAIRAARVLREDRPSATGVLWGAIGFLVVAVWFLLAVLGHLVSEQLILIALLAGGVGLSGLQDTLFWPDRVLYKVVLTLGSGEILTYVSRDKDAAVQAVEAVNRCARMTGA